MIQIKNNLILNDGLNVHYEYKQSPNQSGPFANGLPDTVVIHYTAGGTYGSSVNWLTNKDAKASAHLVIGRKGEIAQLLPFNISAWHAGRSQWNGRSGLNKFSIGIEIANAGILVKRASGYFTSFGKKIDDENVVLATHKNQNEEKAWEGYTQQQLEVVEAICIALKNTYNINEIVGHDDIAPKRKTDPGPAYPLQALRNKVLFGRQDDVAVENDDAYESTIKGIVLADKLNIRNGPVSSASLVTDPLNKGTQFQVLQQQDNWVKIKVETIGWVSKKYVNYFE